MHDVEAFTKFFSDQVYVYIYDTEIIIWSFGFVNTKV